MMILPRYFVFGRTRAWFGYLVVAACLTSLPSAEAQIAPTGYTGAINTPTADVAPVGSVLLSLSNNTPEMPRLYAQDGPFGGVTLGFGLLPGLEAFGRLTYDGDIWCNAYAAGCISATRDISIGAKYQLPLPALPLNGRVALGFSDYGGAANHYRQAYGVGTVSHGAWEASLGYSKPLYYGLMNGTFANLSYRFNEQFRLIAEDDTRERRLGAAYQLDLHPEWSLALGASTKITRQTSQLADQFIATLTHHFDGRAARASPTQQPPFRWFESWFLPLKEAPMPAARPAPALDAAATPTPAAFAAPSPTLAPAPVSTPAALTPLSGPAPVLDALAGLSTRAQRREQAELQAEVLARYGFSNISVAQSQGRWWVKAEPRRWRKNRMDAAGVALAAWLRGPAAAVAPVQLVLTSLGIPVLSIGTSKDCIEAFKAGQSRCGEQLVLDWGVDALAIEKQLASVVWDVRDAHDQSLFPQIEISPGASYTVGTEFGVFDYSLAVSTGWELQLAKGLFWQGYYTQLLDESEDFKDASHYFRRVGLGEKTTLGVNMLTYTRPLVDRLWAEVSAGQLGSNIQGQSLRLTWSTPEGRLRLSGTLANYKIGDTNQALSPQILTARFAAVPGRWDMLLHAGTFLNNDPGYVLETSHRFGDNVVRFFYRTTGPGNEVTPYKRSFGGFSIFFPIGPKESASLGPVTVRGRDRWGVGLETKVGMADNYIEPGYALFPSIRHGLLSDVTDFDRADLGSIRANLYRTRLMLTETMAVPL